MAGENDFEILGRIPAPTGAPPSAAPAAEPRPPSKAAPDPDIEILGRIPAPAGGRKPAPVPAAAPTAAPPSGGGVPRAGASPAPITGPVDEKVIEEDIPELPPERRARLPAAAAEPKPEKPPPKPSLDIGHILAQAQNDDELARVQGVSPHATSKYFSDDPADRPVVLGELQDTDSGLGYISPGPPFVKAPGPPKGEFVLFNPQHEVVLRNPATNRLTVYERNDAITQPSANAARTLVENMLPGVAPILRAPGRLVRATEAAEAAAAAERATEAERAMAAAGVPEVAPRTGGAPAVPPGGPPAGPPNPNVPSAPWQPPPPGGYTKPLAAERQAQRVADIQRDIQAFDELGIRKPPVAFMEGPMAQVGRQMAEVPFVGSPIRSGLEDALVGASRATERIAQGFGTAKNAEQAGATIQQGLERFKDARPQDIVERSMEGWTPLQIEQIAQAPARDTSRKTKQAAMYQRAWNNIPEAMQEGRAVEGLPRVMGKMEQTKALLDEIEARNMKLINASSGNRAAAAPIGGEGSLISQMINAMQSPTRTVSLQTMRDYRSTFRRLASSIADTEKNTLRLSDMERFQSAVTQDMINLLKRNVSEYRLAGDTQTATAMERAIGDFRRADTYTRESARELEYIERLFNAPRAEDLYRQIVSAAQSTRGRGDLEKLRILRNSLRPEEMNDVAAAVLREIGKPTGSTRGAAQAEGFSVNTAATNWGNWSPEGRALIFGVDQARALDNWFRVVNRLSNVEALANTSRSGTHLTNLILGGGAAIGAIHNLPWTVAGVGAGTALTFLMSRPSLTHWVSTYAQAKAAYLAVPSNQNLQQVGAAVNRLYVAAQKDPMLLPIYRTIAAENGMPDKSEERGGLKKLPGKQVGPVPANPYSVIDKATGLPRPPE